MLVNKKLISRYNVVNRKLYLIINDFNCPKNNKILLKMLKIL